VNAIISGQAGVALLIEGDELHSFQVDQPDKVIRRTHREIPFLLGEAKDLQFLNDVDIEEARRRLEKATNEVDALHLALILLDGSLSNDTRETAARELDKLLADEEIGHFVEKVLFAQSLPPAANLQAARASCSEAAGLPLELLEKLEALQGAITEVRRAWDKLPGR